MARKKFRRSTDDKIIAGVLGGVATYYNQDSTLVRIVWLLFLGLTGFIPGVAAYLFAVLAVPKERRKRKNAK